MRKNRNFNYILFFILLFLFVFAFWFSFENQKGLSLEDDLDIIAPSRDITYGDNCFFVNLEDNNINTCRNKAGEKLKIILNDQSIYEDFCIKGCRKEYEYRSTETSIMRDYINEGRFNRLQCAIMVREFNKRFVKVDAYDYKIEYPLSLADAYNKCKGMEGLYKPPPLEVTLSANPSQGELKDGQFRTRITATIKGLVDDSNIPATIQYKCSQNESFSSSQLGNSSFEFDCTYNQLGTYIAEVEISQGERTATDTIEIRVEEEISSPSPSPLSPSPSPEQETTEETSSGETSTPSPPIQETVSRTSKKRKLEVNLLWKGGKEEWWGTRVMFTFIVEIKTNDGSPIGYIREISLSSETGLQEDYYFLAPNNSKEWHFDKNYVKVESVPIGFTLSWPWHKRWLFTSKERHIPILLKVKTDLDTIIIRKEVVIKGRQWPFWTHTYGWCEDGK